MEQGLKRQRSFPHRAVMQMTFSFFPPREAGTNEAGNWWWRPNTFAIKGPILLPFSDVFFFFFKSWTGILENYWRVDFPCLWQDRNRTLPLENTGKVSLASHWNHDTALRSVCFQGSGNCLPLCKLRHGAMIVLFASLLHYISQLCIFTCMETYFWM